MQTPVRVLSGDIGGTKTRLAEVKVAGNALSIEREQTYASRDYAVFSHLLEDFLTGAERPERAAFGIAGPVQGQVAQTTNLPWRIDAEALRIQFDFAECRLCNDLEATAYGLPALTADDLLTLHTGTHIDRNGVTAGNRAVIAAGTGLGEAGIFWDGKQYYPFATEGGHASFSPGNEIEVALLHHLQQRYGHVSWERIVSGPGLVSLHKFLSDYRRATIPAWLNHEMQQGDAAAAIANAALDGRDELCIETLDWFARLYATEAGNLALKMLSRGGLFIGGGIAPKILSCLQQPAFLEAFFSKGRMRPLLEAMPLKVILNEHTALYGAALYAAAAS